MKKCILADFSDIYNDQLLSSWDPYTDNVHTLLHDSWNLKLFLMSIFI